MQKKKKNTLKMNTRICLSIHMTAHKYDIKPRLKLLTGRLLNQQKLSYTVKQRYK
jgi:hypothetical protein